MKRKGKIILAIVLVIVIVVVGLLFWQRNNIKALQYLSMDQSELEQRSEKNEQVFQHMLDEYEIKPPTFTPEELGKLTEDGADMNQAAQDMLNGLIGQANATTDNPEEVGTVGAIENSKPTKPDSNNGKETENVVKTENSQAIRAQVAKMYILKAKFVSRLESVAASAKSDFAALPPEQRNANGKKNVIQAKMGQLGALESQCDGEVAAVVSELRRLLKEAGESTALADQVQSAYAEEKSVRKAYYMGQMGR